jgi:hypothetical protein
MTLRKTLALICQVLTTLCFVVGVAKVGLNFSFAGALTIMIIWLSANKWPAPWLTSAALLVSIGWAAFGLLVGASPWLMLLGVTLDLAIWDLVQLDHVLTGGLSTSAVAFLEKKHYQSLAQALGLAILATFIGRMIRFQIPFVVMILLVTIAVFSLVRVWHMLSD